MPDATSASPAPKNAANTAPATGATAPVAGAAVPADKARERQAKMIADAARKDAELRREREALKAEREKFDLERKAIEGKLSRAALYDELEKLSKTDRRAALSKLGIDLTELNKEALTDGKDPAQLIQRKFDEYRAEQERREKEREDKAAAEHKSASEKQDADRRLSAARSTIADLVKNGGDKYELVRVNHQEEAALQIMAANFEKTGRADMSYERALELAEADLERQVKEEWSKSEKLKKLLAPQTDSTKTGSPSLVKPPPKTVVTTPQQTTTQGQPAAPRKPFNMKRHLDDLLARHRASQGA